MASPLANVMGGEMTLSLKEREFVLIGMLVAKASVDFFREYDRLAHLMTEPENQTPETNDLYEYYRDSSLMLESMLPKLQKAHKEQGTVDYNFEAYVAMLEKKGGKL